MTLKQSRYEPTDWWKTHFSGLLLDLWLSIVPSEQATRDADFLQTECRLAPGSSILDVPCGDGRVALALAERGFHLTGVDISHGLLREARQGADLRQLTVEWHERDMRTLPWCSRFDAAFCWADSFGYFDDAGNQDFLQAVERTLKPGGRWAMEMKMISEVLFPRYRADEAGEVAGIQVGIHRNYDAPQGRMSVEYSLARGGAVETRLASYRIYSCREVCSMLDKAGLVVGGLYGGAGEPFQVGSDRLRLIATKRNA